MSSLASFSPGDIVSVLGFFAFPVLLGTMKLFTGLASLIFIVAALFFGYEQSWMLFLRRQVTRAVDFISLHLNLPTELGEEGLGKYYWLPWVPAGLGVFFVCLILSSAGLEVTTIIGINILIIATVALYFQKPGMWVVRNLPKARFRPDIEEYLSGIASDMGMPEVQFRIDESEGINVYGYECEYDGEVLKYVVFGGEISRSVQEYDTPENPNMTSREILAFALAHELSHIKAGDTKAKHDAIRFLFPFQGINRTFFRAKAAMASSNVSHASSGFPDGRNHLGYSFFSGILSFLQLPHYLFFALILLPFHAFSYKMEHRADKQALSVLASSKTAKQYGIHPENAARSYLRYMAECKSRLLYPSFFEAAMTVHSAPSDRAEVLGVKFSVR